MAHENPGRREADRQPLRRLLLAGAASPPSAPLDARYFQALRRRVQQRAGTATRPHPGAAPGAG